MVVALSCFYCPTSNTKPSTSYLGALIDTDKIKTYNWGKLVHGWNLFYIKKYQKSTSTLAMCNYYFAVSMQSFILRHFFHFFSILGLFVVWNDIFFVLISWPHTSGSMLGFP